MPAGRCEGAAPILSECNESEFFGMSLKLYFHPLSSFCQKVLIALYENGTPFEPHIIDLMNDTARAEFRRIWPIGKFPVLRDEAHDRTIPESSIIIEYLALHYPGTTQLLPDAPELAWQTRLHDRFFDLSVNVPMRCRAGEIAVGDVSEDDRRGNESKDLGDGRCLHHGRLCSRAGAVLCECSDALQRHV
jgi:glutathione S-transferase